MSEWAIAGIVITIIGGGWSIVKAVASVIKPLTEQITKLNESMTNITSDLAELTERNSKTHARIYSAIEGHDAKITDHEIRIVKLEEHEKKIIKDN